MSTRDGARMRLIELSQTADTVPQIISELAGRYFLSEQFVASIALTMLDEHAIALSYQENPMLHQLFICAAILLVYILVLLLIYPFAKVASYKPYPQPSTTTRIELTLSTRVCFAAYPNKRTGASTTQTFVFGGELANTVTDFLSEFNSPSISDLKHILECADDRIADVIITTHNANTIRQLTLLGPDAEEVSSYLTFCFKYQLASGPKELSNEHVSFSR